MERAESEEPEVPPAGVRALRAVGAILLRIPRRWALVPVFGWAGLIFFVSSRPVPSFGGAGPIGGVLENFAHALVYGVFAVCLCLGARRRRDAHGEWVDLRVGASAVLLAIVLLYAASDEWHQSFVPDRDASAFDVLTDFTGASATLGCIAAIGRNRGSGRALAVRFALGLLACVAAAALATWAPGLFEAWTHS